MARRKRGNKKAAVLTVGDAVTDICRELRGVLRLRQELSAPLEQFAKFKNSEGETRYAVMFDLNRRKRINGLKHAGIKRIRLQDELIWDKANEFAKAVWHLKDYIGRYAAAANLSLNLDAYANQSKEMKICADLANRKKHGTNRNRSGLNPSLGLVTFDTSRNGQIEFYYDGGTKDKEIIVENPIPIHFGVEVLRDGDCDAVIGDARTIISCAFDHWVKLLGSLNCVPKDHEVLQSVLFLKTPLTNSLVGW